jgi:hypothetical protein
VNPLTKKVQQLAKQRKPSIRLTSTLLLFGHEFLLSEIDSGLETFSADEHACQQFRRESPGVFARNGALGIAIGSRWDSGSQPAEAINRRPGCQLRQ